MSQPKIEAESITSAERKPIEHWQAQRGVPRWLHLGAVRLHRWGVGRELTEKEYLNGVEAMASHKVEV